MQHTQNYQLPTWEKSDRIMMEDFNDMTQKIESAIDGAKGEASAAVEAAKSEASSAEQELRQEIGNCYKPENKPYVVGTYTGTGAEQTVELGFQPTAVILGQEASSNYPYSGFCNCTIHTKAGPGGHNACVALTQTGFKLFTPPYNVSPKVNEELTEYLYVALR